MDCRWVACLLLVGCFSDPPSGGSGGDTGSSTGSPSTSSTTNPTSADASAEGSTSTFGSSTADTFDLTTIGSTTNEPEGCVLDESCIMPPPPSWNGPLVGRIVEDALIDPMCPPGTDEVFRAGRDPAAACDCTECSSEDVACDVNIEWGVFGSCNTTTIGTGCQPFHSEESGQLFLAVEVGGGKAAACTLPEPSQPQFRLRAVACQPPDRACEDGGTCVAGRACIWREGEHACPPAFEAREVLYDGFDAEDLSCDTCGCALDGIPCSEATLTPYGEESCDGDAVAQPLTYFSVNDPVCESYFDPGQVVLADDVFSLDIETNEVGCSSNQDVAAASGTFTTVAPLTLCCSE